MHNRCFSRRGRLLPLRWLWAPTAMLRALAHHELSSGNLQQERLTARAKQALLRVSRRSIVNVQKCRHNAGGHIRFWASLGCNSWACWALLSRRARQKFLRVSSTCMAWPS